MAEALPYRSRGEANAYGFDEGDNEEEEEDVDETGYKTVKDAVLFAIDVSKSMLEEPTPNDSKLADTNSPLLAALKCAYHLMQQRIMSNPKDMMGVLLYNTEASKFQEETKNSRGGWSFPHCYLLVDLDVPDADDVKALRSLVQDESDAGRELLKPTKEPISMHHVLFCANQIFQSKAPNFTSRRLFIVTDNDDPHASDKAFRTSAAVRAKDLYDLGVVIELFPISSSTHTFDTKLFYDDIVYRSNPSDPDAIAYNPAALTDSHSDALKAGSKDGLTLLQSLLSSIASKSTPKRTLFSSVPLELAPNLRISVKGYLLYKRQAPVRSTYIYLGSERPQIAVGKTAQQSDESERKVEKFEIRKAYTFGGEQILFTPEETKQLRNFGDPVIRLIGFKPASTLPLWANTKQSTFLYPSEEDFIGSTRVFSALHQKLLKSKLMAVTWFIARRNAAPVIAVLIPTLPAPDKDAKTHPTGASSTGCPQGLHLIPLPFADDIRQSPSMPGVPPIAPDALVDAMTPVIRQLNLPRGTYDPNKYPNPSLQWFYRILQAMALDEDVPSKPDDKTLPKYRQIEKRVGVEVVQWKKELDTSYQQYRDEHADAIRPTGSKRVAANGDQNGGSKKIKADPGEIINEEKMRQLWQKGTIASLTVPQLKDFCMVRRLALGGKKADLVERIEGWLESK